MPTAPRVGATEEQVVNVYERASGYVIANGVDRKTADALRHAHDAVVVSRNADGTYRVTRAR